MYSGAYPVQPLGPTDQSYGSGRTELSVAVDDPAAVQVVGRQLDSDPVAREDPDPVPAHLAGRVAQRLVPVVERDPEHSVPQRLDDLAFELDLLFFAGDESLTPDCDHVRRLRALRTLANLELDLLALVQGLVPLACDLRVMDEDVLRLSVGRDEDVTLRVVEPLDDAGSHVEDTLPLILNGKEAPNWLRRLLVLFVAVRVAPEA